MVTTKGRVFLVTPQAEAGRIAVQRIWRTEEGLWVLLKRKVVPDPFYFLANLLAGIGRRVTSLFGFASREESPVVPVVRVVPVIVDGQESLVVLTEQGAELWHVTPSHTLEVSGLNE